MGLCLKSSGVIEHRLDPHSFFTSIGCSPSSHPTLGSRSAMNDPRGPRQSGGPVQQPTSYPAGGPSSLRNPTGLVSNSLAAARSPSSNSPAMRLPSFAELDTSIARWQEETRTEDARGEELPPPRPDLYDFKPFDRPERGLASQDPWTPHRKVSDPSDRAPIYSPDQRRGSDASSYPLKPEWDQEHPPYSSSSTVNEYYARSPRHPNQPPAGGPVRYHPFADSRSRSPIQGGRPPMMGGVAGVRPYDMVDMSGPSGAPIPRRRGKLPKDVTIFLRDWLMDHSQHPYPTDEEKQYLCSQTGLQMVQVSNWFINARRRILGRDNQAAASGGGGGGGTASSTSSQGWRGGRREDAIGGRGSGSEDRISPGSSGESEDRRGGQSPPYSAPAPSMHPHHRYEGHGGTAPYPHHQVANPAYSSPPHHSQSRAVFPPSTRPRATSRAEQSEPHWPVHPREHPHPHPYPHQPRRLSPPPAAPHRYPAPPHHHGHQ